MDLKIYVELEMSFLKSSFYLILTTSTMLFVSEILPFVSSTKYNGIIHMIYNLLSNREKKDQDLHVKKLNDLLFDKIKYRLDLQNIIDVIPKIKSEGIISTENVKMTLDQKTSKDDENDRPDGRDESNDESEEGDEIIVVEKNPISSIPRPYRKCLFCQ
jgi:hypothetical protein